MQFIIDQNTKQTLVPGSIRFVHTSQHSELSSTLSSCFKLNDRAPCLGVGTARNGSHVNTLNIFISPGSDHQDLWSNTACIAILCK